MKLFLSGLVPAVVVLGALSGCTGNSPTGNGGGGGTTVNATASLVFSPASVTVGVGQSVTWKFAAVAHTVTFDAGGTPPASIGESINTSVSRTFPTAGNYPYHCTIHAGMAGTVHVGAAGSTDTTTIPGDTTGYPGYARSRTGGQ